MVIIIISYHEDIKFFILTSWIYIIITKSWIS